MNSKLDSLRNPASAFRTASKARIELDYYDLTTLAVASSIEKSTGVGISVVKSAPKRERT